MICTKAKDNLINIIFFKSLIEAFGFFLWPVAQPYFRPDLTQVRPKSENLWAILHTDLDIELQSNPRDFYNFFPEICNFLYCLQFKG